MGEVGGPTAELRLEFYRPPPPLPPGLLGWFTLGWSTLLSEEGEAGVDTGQARDAFYFALRISNSAFLRDRFRPR